MLVLSSRTVVIVGGCSGVASINVGSEGNRVGGGCWASFAGKTAQLPTPAQQQTRFAFFALMDLPSFWHVFLSTAAAHETLYIEEYLLRGI
jgi:hypothetical protein